MAYGKTYSYTLKFNADVSSIRTQVQSVLDELSVLAKQRGSFSFDNSIREGASAALLLGRNLQNAFNVDTNKLDLTKFTRTLNASGLTIEQYRDKLLSMGDAGYNAFMKAALAIAKAETPAMRLNKIMDNLWITMKNTMRWQLTSSMLHGFIGTVQTAWRYTQDLNESLNAIRIVTGKSNDEMAVFAQEANKAAQALNTTTTNYTDASLIYYQQGLDAEEVKERTRITIDAANAAGTSAEQMSEYLTAVWNSYQVATDQLESYVDKMAAVGANTATSLEEISTAMVNVASTANTVGVSMDQLTAIISTVASTTRQSATTIGTAYKTIFARMGDLKLGETLEDGLDLGSVSGQLEAVGVEVLDVSGNLRDMGSVVEEIGEKWQGWTTAQQTAVAQAIAGKRQYTQLIALFDNWDDYQNALNISETSEGTLAKQAETFAESWEAARKNVKAAAEGIYDSLFNADTWIGLDQVLTKVLNRIENIIDTVGGLGGIFNASILGITTLYKDKLVNGLRSAADGFSVLAGEQRKINQNAREQLIDSINGINNSEVQNDTMRERIKLQIQYEDQRRNMTEAQRTEVENEMQIYDYMQQEYKKLVDITAQTKEAIDAYKVLFSTMSGTRNKNDMELIYRSSRATHADKNVLRMDQQSAENYITSKIVSTNKGIKESEARARASKAMVQYEKDITRQIEQSRTALGGIRQIQTAVNDLKQNEIKSGKTNVELTKEQLSKVTNLVKAFSGLTDSAGKNILFGKFGIDPRQIDSLVESLENGTITGAEFERQINEMASKIEQAANTAEKGAVSWSKSSEEVNAFGNNCEKAGGQVVQEAQATEVSAEAKRRLVQAIQNGSDGINDWANKMVAAGRVASSVLMAFRSLTNISNLLDEAMEGNEVTVDDVTMALTSLVMIMPLLVGSTKALASAIGIETTVTAASTVKHNGHAVALAAEKIAMKLLGKETASTAAVMGVLAGGITVLVAVAFGLVKLLDVLIVTQEEASESINNAIKKYEEERQKLEELSNSLQEVQERIEELNEQDSLTIVEQEELDKLNREVILLKQQKALQEEINRRAQQKAAREIVKNSGKATEFTSNLDLRFDTGEITFDAGNNPRSERLTAQQYFDKYLAQYQNYTEEQLNSLSEAEKESYQTRYEQYKDFLRKEQDATTEYVDKYEEDIQNAEDRFATFIEAVNSGAYTASSPEELERQIGKQLADIKTVRMSVYGNNKAKYQEAVIQPILDSEEIESGANQLYQQLSQGLDGKAFFNDESNKELKKTIRTAGITINDFLDYLDTQINTTKDKVNEALDGTETHFEELTAEDWNILAELELKGVDTWDELVQAIEEHKQNELNVDVKVDDGGLSTLMGFLDGANTKEGSLEKALENYSKQGYLTMDQVQELIKENESYAEYIIKTAEGEYALNNLIYRDFLELENAEKQALDETIDLMQERNGVNREYLNDYISNYQEVQRIMREDIARDADDTDYFYDNKEKSVYVKDLAKYLENNSRLFRDGEKDIVQYFNTISAAISGVANGFEDLDKEIEDTSEKTDNMEIVFSSMSGEIASGLTELNRLWKQGKITMQQYYDGTIAGSQAAIRLLAKQHSNSIELVDGEWKAKEGAMTENINLLDATERAAARAHDQEIESAIATANGYQQAINKAQAMLPVVDAITNNFDYLKDYADTFGSIDFTINDNFDQTSQRFQTMCDEIGGEMENLIQNDETMYNQLIANLEAEGVEFNKNTLKSEGVLTNLMKNDAVAAATVVDTATGATGKTIADVTDAAGKVIKALGDLISHFDYSLKFTFEGKASGIADWLMAAVNGNFSNVQLPTLKLTGDGNGGTVGAFAKALQDVGSTLSGYATSNLNKQLASEAATAPLGRNQGGLWGFGDPDDYWKTAYDKLDPESVKTDNLRPDKDKDKKSGGKGSSSSKGSTIDDQEEVEERYHVINKLIEEQERLLKKVQTQIDRTYGGAKLKEFGKEQKRLNDLIESQKTKMEEAEFWAEKDLGDLRELGLSPEIEKESGRILNYMELLRQADAEYQAFIDEWNSHENDIAEEGEKTWQELNEQRKEDEKKKYDDRIDALKKFEESVQTYWEEFEKREQYLRDLEDNKLRRIAYALEFQVDYKNAKKDIRNLAKMIEEAIGDALSNGVKTAALDFQNMQDELNMKGVYENNLSLLIAKIDESKTNPYIDQEELANQLENLRDNVIGSAEALIEWAESIEEIVPDAIDAARERFDQFTNQLEHNTSIIDTIKEIMVLQGLTIKTAQGYRDTRELYTKRMDATLAQAKLNRQWYENALKDLEIAQAELNTAVEGTERYDILKANRDALLEEFNASQEAMLESAKETMDTAREMYVDAVERTAYELEQTLTRGDGFDLLQDKYDHYIDTEERYLDTVNKIYETTKLNNKLQAKIDESTNEAHTKRLKELQDEFIQREKNNKLSEYDIQIMNAKLAVIEKQMALEDAANNRSTLRLVRNSRGNYDYQFTANPDDLNDLNQQYLDSAQEWYNIAKDKVQEATGAIVDTWQEMTEKIKEIYEDEALTVDEREARIAEIRGYYTQKVKDLEAEKQKAIVDMTEAGNIAIQDFRDNHKDVLEEMGGDVDNFRDIFSEDLAAILEGSDEFNNEFATDMDNLSEEVNHFEELFDETIDKMNSHADEFNEKINEVNDQVGTSYEDLKGILDQVSDSTEQVAWKGQDAVRSMQDQITAAMEASVQYANMADSVLAAARAYQELAERINEAQFERLGMAEEFEALSNKTDFSNDFSALQAYYLAHGGKLNDENLAKLQEIREDKVKWMKELGLDSYEVEGEENLKRLEDQESEWFKYAATLYDDEEAKKLLEKYGIKLPEFATGGYTGDFDNGRLAILHEKELILNQNDTKNILDAVNLVRGSNSIWTDIAKTLDASIRFAMSVLSGKFFPSVRVEREQSTLQQQVDIHAEFPNVSDSSEIEEALSNLVNNAAQFASQRN